MDSIKIFLENMFYGFNETQAITKAKQELLSMMEDKYNELKAEGKSENEAVGQVISEFGNLDELADDLGIREDLQSNKKDEQVRDVPRQFLNQTEVQTYRSDSTKAGKKFAFAAFLFIISPIVLIATASLQEQTLESGANLFNRTVQNGVIGLIFLFLCIIAGVVISIFTGIEQSKWDYLEVKLIATDPATRRLVEQDYDSSRKPFAVQIALGVSLVLLAVLQVVITGAMFEENEQYLAISVSVLLVLIALATYIFIAAGTKRSSMAKILNLDDYSENSIRGKRSTDPFAGPYWILVTAGYLIWSFLTHKWQITWIVWPIAGLVFAAIEGIIGNIRRNRV